MIATPIHSQEYLIQWSVIHSLLQNNVHHHKVMITTIIHSQK